MNTVGRAPQQHPSEATLLAHASGGLGAAHRLVVATHTMQCADCHSKIRTAERVGGLLLDGLARIIHRTARNRPRPPNTWARDFIAKNFIKQPIRIVVSDSNGLALIAHFS